MIVVGCCFAGDGTGYRSMLEPTLEDRLEELDVLLAASGDTRGIAAVYNDFVRRARAEPACEALVLVHDDVEVLDTNFRSKVLQGAREDDVGVVGVVGGAGLTSLAWWEARRTAGSVHETRGYTELGTSRADVDAVDGLLLVLAPRAFHALGFDEVSFPHFHGYDVDYCLQARTAGLRVVVRPFDILHRTKGGYGDRAAFEVASTVAAKKWPHLIRSSATLRARTAAARPMGIVRASARRGARALRDGRTRAVRQRLDGAPIMPRVSAPPESMCLACGKADVRAEAGTTTQEQAILVCRQCGTGLTWPPPARLPESDGIWTDRYGGSRLRRRPVWLAEARQRIRWIQLYLPEGVILEVGSGTGEFVKVATDEGFEALGVEPSEWAATQAASLGAHVYRGDLADWGQAHPGLHVDAIALWHVVEHLPDPVSVMRDIRKTLRPGGLVFIEVPNFASTEARRLGMAWDGAQPADHYVQFTPDGLAKLLGRAGLEVRELLPITRRPYESTKNWKQQRNAALVACHAWPSLDLLRAVAAAPRT